MSGWTAAAIVGGAVIGGVASNRAAGQAADANRAATDAAAQSTADRLAFDKQVYGDSKADRDWASANAKQMALWQGEDRTKYNALQDEQIARGRVYQGNEDKMLADANSYDTEAKRNELAGLAMANVNQGYSSASGQENRRLQRMGVNPSSGASIAMNNQIGLSQASSLASAANQARTQAEALGYARKMDALGLGKGLIGNQATQASLGLGAGNASVANGMSSLNPNINANNAMSTGYGNASVGLQNIANLQSKNFYGAQQYGAGVGQNVGNMFGNLITRYGSYNINPGAGLASANQYAENGWIG